MVATEYNSPQTIIDNLHSAVVVIGENMQIVCINPAAEMLFHISNTRAVKKNICELVINEQDFFDRLQRSLISAHPYTVYEDQLLVHNHKTINVDYSVSPIQYKSEGKFLLLEFIRIKSKHKLSHEKSILSQYEASKSLLRGLAHEIKNPLGGIRGSAQLLERELAGENGDDNSNRQFTQIIINETDRLKNLLDRMVGPRDIPTKTNNQHTQNFRACSPAGAGRKQPDYHRRRLRPKHTGAVCRRIDDGSGNTKYHTKRCNRD